MKKIVIPVLFYSMFSFGQDTLSKAPLQSGTQKNEKKALQPELWTFDFYGTIPDQMRGLGAGMGFFSPSLNKHIGLKNPYSPEIRIGFDFYYVETAHKTFYNVPLNLPQTGEARVRLSQNSMAFNIAGRISGNYSKKFIPYFDMFGGWRSFGASMNITPNVRQPGYESSTSSNLSMVTHLNYGAAIGVMYSLGKQVKLNTALLYSTSPFKAEVSDVLNARNEANGIVTQKTGAPKDMFVFKLGITVLIDFKDTKGSSDCDCRHGRRAGSVWGGGTINGGGKSNTIKIINRPTT